MSPDSPTDRQRILLVTGMLGAGKTTALHELEDLGWEAVDNFPIRLLGRLIGRDGERAEGDTPPLAIGFDSRTRGFAPDRVIERVKQFSARDDLEVTTLFLDCSTAELQRRFDETRRRHHLAQDVPVDLGILAERELLAPLRRWADVLIETTRFSSNELRQVIRQHFAGESSGQMTVTVSSFGFSRGVPPAADLVFDMRFLDNPHWQPELRDLTGLDEPVGAHIVKDEAFDASFGRIRELLLDLLPRYAAQGKSHVNIAFGCTGGRHRSVFTVERIAAALREGGFSPTVLHRNLGSRAAELIEGSHQP
ncbi:MAG: RNase adapter RapZ [Croceibacterium sp.]